MNKNLLTIACVKQLLAFRNFPLIGLTSPAIFTLAFGFSVVFPAIYSVQAQTTINYLTSPNPPLTADALVSSTAASSTITVTDGTQYRLGDVIRFTGTTATTNPFNNTASNYYILSVSGNDIAVSTTPGGAAVNAVNTTSATTTALGQDLLVGTNWTGGTAPNSNSQIANFGNTVGSVPAYVVNGATPGAGQTLYGLTFNGGGSSDLTLVSGWSGTGTGLNALTFATNDASTPTVTETGTTRLIAFGSTVANAAKLVVAGTQGLKFNSRTGGALTGGAGTTATSAVPAKEYSFSKC